jgi:hypothetical protein
MPKIVLEFFGEVPNVKDSYRATIRKRKKPIPGKPDVVAGIVKDRKLNAKLNYLIEQIPQELWDVRLLHPKITFERFCPMEYLTTGKGQSLPDRSGSFVTLEDLLVRTKIIEDDGDLYNNGPWVIWPTRPSDCHKIVLTLETEGI